MISCGRDDADRIAPRTRFLAVAPVALLAIVLAGCPHARKVEPVTHVESESTSIFRPGAIKKLQEALTREGYQMTATGELDDDTQRALRSYQRRHGMVETGMPDQETLRRLGLKPDEIYQNSPDQGAGLEPQKR